MPFHQNKSTMAATRYRFKICKPHCWQSKRNINRSSFSPVQDPYHPKQVLLPPPTFEGSINYTRDRSAMQLLIFRYETASLPFSPLPSLCGGDVNFFYSKKHNLSFGAKRQSFPGMLTLPSTETNRGSCSSYGALPKGLNLPLCSTHES